MKRFHSLSLTCVFGFCCFLRAETPDMSLRVQQLGSESFAEREAASLALWTIGELALPELRAAAESPDPEVRLRAVELLENIGAGLRPSWPEALRERAKAYRADSREIQEKFLRDLLASEKNEAFPFLLARAEATETDAKMAVDLLLQHLRGLLDTHEYAGVDALTGAWMKVLAGESRFLYLRAAALAHLHQAEAAAALCETALALHPDDQQKHYAAAQLLEELKQFTLARMEWRQVLDIPPQDDVYDLNAHMNIGRIHAIQKKFGEAADAFETGLRLFREAKAGGAGWGMTLTEAELEERIAQLRKKAAALKEGVTLELQITVKEDGKEALDRLRAQADCRMSINIQPHGIRLFDVAPTTLAYDAKQKKLQVLLNGSPVAEGVPATFGREKPVVGIQTLDMWYFYEMNLPENSARRIASFELEYVLRITPNPRLAAWESVGMSVNGTAYTWKELAEGLPFDFLPEKLAMDVQGRTPEGKEATIQFESNPAKLAPEN